MAERKAGKKKNEETPGEVVINIYGLDGAVIETIGLPPVFSTPFRPDLIRRAVVAAQANRRQRYGPATTSGMRHAVSTWGKGRGVARVQRIKAGRKAAQSPNNVGGRRAHPPRPEHHFTKMINVKERRLATASALAATAVQSTVKARGHLFKEDLTLPVVVVDAVEELNRTKDIYNALGSLGLDMDLKRASEGKHIRAGRGKMRGRRFRQPKSILIVASEGSALLSGARNLPGVNTISPKNLNTELLAPGGDPGRLVLFSKKAFTALGGN